jgi:hypothetical protein
MVLDRDFLERLEVDRIVDCLLNDESWLARPSILVTAGSAWVLLNKETGITGKALADFP